MKAMIIYDLSLRQQLNKSAAKQTMERYRSGHNEAVLKTVCPQGRVGSNPTLSVKALDWSEAFFAEKMKHFTIEDRYYILNNVCLEKYPSWPKGLPWKGSRSFIAARGFKSLFLRLWYIDSKLVFDWYCIRKREKRNIK